MAHRLASERTPSSPEWLRARWDQQRRETVARVTRAVDHLRSQEQPVTFSAIRDAVKHLDGVSISTNTMLSNNLTYPIYQQHASTRRSGRRRHQSFTVLLDRTTALERSELHTKIISLSHT